MAELDDSTRAILARLEQERVAAHEAFDAAASRNDTAAMVEMSIRGSEISDEIRRLTDPEWWQAGQLVKSWSAGDQESFSHWACGFAPNVVLRFELSRRQLSRRQLPPNRRTEPPL